ncbi:MAG: hypothetical protein PVH61_13820 [Candidatus Aminicenantes bacterium]|jgi:hypothetical protein
MIETKIIKGNKGKTVIYSIPNFQYDDLKIKWDAFKFFTPVGDQVDAEGFSYFDVPADVIPITRDDTLDKVIFVISIYTGSQFEVIPIELFAGQDFTVIYTANESFTGTKNNFAIEGDLNVLEIGLKLNLSLKRGENIYRLINIDKANSLITVDPPIEDLSTGDELSLAGPIVIGLEGDILIEGYIPANTGEDVSFILKEVIDG